MAVSALETVNVRRHAGYSASGAQPDDALAAALAAISAEGETVLRTLFLPALDGLEAAILNSGEGLDTKSAAVWHRNENELLERSTLYRAQRLALCHFLGVEPGPGIDTLWVVPIEPVPGETPAGVYPPAVFVV